MAPLVQEIRPGFTISVVQLESNGRGVHDFVVGSEEYKEVVAICHRPKLGVG